MSRIRLKSYRKEVEREVARSDAMHQALAPAGKRIATATRSMSPMARSEPGRYGQIDVERNPQGGVTVTTSGSFAHIDEWGGAQSPPSAAMRRAAAREGKFRETSR